MIFAVPQEASAFGAVLEQDGYNVELVRVRELHEIPETEEHYA